MDLMPTHRAPFLWPSTELTLGAVVLAALLWVTHPLVPLTATTLVLAAVLYIGLGLTIVTGLNAYAGRFGPADRITLARAVLVLFLASLTGTPAVLQDLAWPYALLCLLALIMDGADGFVARHTHTASAFGARFDMELDAFFILVLCFAVMVSGTAGPWVLLIGLMRYGFVMAGWRWRWLNEPLPESFRRKTICVWQLVTLMAALLPFIPDLLGHAALLLALALLTGSFALDIRYLHQNRNRRRL